MLSISPIRAITFTLFFIASAPAFAAKHALLIGIGHYRQSPLEGPQYDVAAMHEFLKETAKYKAHNIERLLNEKATKPNILNALEKLYERSRPGDSVFIYFSGHGTSAKDKTNYLPLPQNSGAFVPYGLNYRVDTNAQITEQLVVGKTDLRPRLQKLDEGNRKVFFIIDACFAGNTARALMAESKLPQRSVNPYKYKSSNHTGLDSLLNNDDIDIRDKPADAYPYRNIYSLSASGDHETAMDINRRNLKKYPTIDGKPHGAFTDALLKVLVGKVKADVNNDAFVTFAEIYSAVRGYMRERNYTHRPVALPTLAEDSQGLQQQAFFSADNLNADNPSSADEPLRISIAPEHNALKTEIKKLPGVRVVNDRFDMYLPGISGDGKFIVRSDAGDMIIQLIYPSADRILEFISYQRWLKTMLTELSKNQPFSVSATFNGHGVASTLLEGERLGISVKVDEASRLLVINFEPGGKINVLHPHRQSDLDMLPANQLFNNDNFAKVKPPFGRDTVVVLAIKGHEGFVEKMRGTSFFYNSPQGEKFEQFLLRQPTSYAYSILELYTLPNLIKYQNSSLEAGAGGLDF